MEQMQFTAIVLMVLLASKLLMLPRMAVSNLAAYHSRMLMTVGVVLILVQFIVQYVFKLRAMGVTQAVMLNLFCFIPASWVFSLAVLYLRRRGHITMFDKYIGLITWGGVTILILAAAIIDGQPFLSATPELYWAEILGSLCFAAMQCYYAWRQLSNLRGMREALLNYYDSDISIVLRWMQLSVGIIASMALAVPLLIFFTGYWLVLYAVLMLGGIFYLVDSYCNFLLSASFTKMQEAEQNEDISKSNHLEANGEETARLPEDVLFRVEHAVKQWEERGGYLKSGMKLPSAAEDMQLPRYLLSAWLKHRGCRYNEWLTDLRIDEAKRMLKAHPDWSNEAIAIHCGFSDRSYFQKKFKERTGFSPTEYLNYC